MRATARAIRTGTNLPIGASIPTGIGTIIPIGIGATGIIMLIGDMGPALMPQTTASIGIIPRYARMLVTQIMVMAIITMTNIRAV
ncbi:MAG TPA: hypothetical protein VMF50_09690 [Candidatus Binataceae bacterium]|nr:hypothetical protein [Candidatus Binataceae bacterium]